MWDRRQKMWDKRQKMWNRRDMWQETEDRRCETGDKRRETETSDKDMRKKNWDRRCDKWDKDNKMWNRRWFSDVMSEKFCAFNLAGELYQFERTLIDNQKKKLAVATKSAKWDKKIFFSVFRCMKNLADLAVLCTTKFFPIKLLYLSIKVVYLNFLRRRKLWTTVSSFTNYLKKNSKIWPRTESWWKKWNRRKIISAPQDYPPPPQEKSGQP